MRGKPLFSALGGNNSGITPADAGKTRHAQAETPSGGDHPRGCGENCVRQVPTRSCDGSPPRMRGKPSDYSRKGAVQRITPADAGKTSISFRTKFSAEDHPRGCGENSLLMQGSCDDAGSPPRMRGKPAPATDSRDSVRITPADAGKTKTNQRTAKHDEDHPRGCGENVLFALVHRV